jgi:nucleoside-diphosphate-sugar epimerase
MAMTFFITGASSFIGVELCRYLSDNGHSVIAMSRRENEHLEEIKKDGHLQVFRADMLSLFDKAKGISADVFIHLAWAGTTHEDRNNPAIHEENVRLSLECVNLAKQMGCQLYVDAGSQAEYGIVPGVLTENTPCNPISAYGKGKLKMYQESAKLTKKLGLKYIHLRILSVYGENDHDETLIKSALKKLKANEPIEMRSGGQKWNYVYVKDAARQIAELSFYAVNDDSFHQEVYNIASNDTRLLQDFIKVMKSISNSSSDLSFGGYNPEKDVNLNPDTNKTSVIVKPLTKWRYEDILSKMSIFDY